jgi:phosphoenolpyruvate synthase/pyruvate phosphate dikinase
MITPDNYIVQKHSTTIKKQISEQTRKVVLDIEKG